MRRTRDERGDSLVEIVMSIVLIGLVVGAFFATFSTGATGSSAQRDLATADAVLRDYAESIKAAVADQTTGCGATNPTTFIVDYTPPAGFQVDSAPRVDVAQPCPPKTDVRIETLTVTMPNKRQNTLEIGVRTP